MILTVIISCNSDSSDRVPPNNPCDVRGNTGPQGLEHRGRSHNGCERVVEEHGQPVIGVATTRVRVVMFLGEQVAMNMDDVTCSPSRRNVYGTGVHYRISGLRGLPGG